MRTAYLIIALALGVSYSRRINKASVGAASQANLVQDVLSGAGSGPDGKNWNAYYSFQEFMKAEGFTPEQIAQLQARFYEDGMSATQWPMRDHAQELLDSVENFANNNKGGIEAAIQKAGGNPASKETLTPAVCSQTENILDTVASEEGPGSSMLEKQSSSADPFGSLPWVTNTVAQNQASVSYLGNSMNMLTGSVATNTAAVASLTGAVGSNTAALTAITGQVGLMGQATAPTMALATALGVQTGTVATLAMAGSFVGPLVGVIALIYVTWPEEEIDPWLKVSARVENMISARFDAKRRKKLGDRMRRYVRQFAQCAKAWVSTSMVKDHGIALPKWIVDDARSAKHSGNFNFTVSGKIRKLEHDPKYPVPPCMQELEGHMSLERDEWYDTESGGISGLFMPFANMHTQMLSMLADYPANDNMQWRPTLKSTAAEYGAYMLEHVLGAWNAQVCRTMRLRHSKNGLTGGWKYQYVVLKPKYQPNAAKKCSSNCEGNGWCDWCGGKNVGACCKSDATDAVCKQFDAPLDVGIISTAAPDVCVHADCIQTNTAYYGKNAENFKEPTEKVSAEECQQICQDYPDATYFSSKDGACTCLKAAEATRHVEMGSESGPTVCGKPDDSVEAREEAYEDNLNEKMPNVPMEEVEPCEDKSTGESDFPSVEKNSPEWVKGCLTKSAEVVTGEFNKFYKRIGKFLDSMAWMAGCGAQRELQWDEGGWTKVSKDFDAGSFGDCDWKREEEMEKTMMIWSESEERARGWISLGGGSRVNMEEQAKATIKFPMPAWLHDLRRQQECLKKTTAGDVEEDGADGRSTAVDTLMDSVAMSDNDMESSSELNQAFNREVNNAQA